MQNIDNHANALLRVLAATIAGRAALSLGPVSQVHIEAVLAGLDITSKLVVVSRDHGAMGALRALAPADLRLSLHVQPLGAFLGDIAAHRFGLVVVTAEGADVLDTALDMIEPGGVVVGLTGSGPFAHDVRFEVADIALDGLSWIAVRRERARPVRRTRPRPSRA